LVRAIVDIFFNYNVAFISRRVGRGQLDHLLLQPQALWMALLTDGFSPFTGSGMLVPSAVLLGWSVHEVPIALSASWFGLLTAKLLASVLTLLAVVYAWARLEVWAPGYAEEMNASTCALCTQLGVFPVDGVGALLLSALLSIVPDRLIAWRPARVLVGLD